MNITPTSPPSALREMQTWMQECLLDPAQVDPGEAARRLTASNRLTVQQRLGIYQSSYINRLCQCLKEQFPALAYTLGEEVFGAFARTYLGDLPSDSYTLYALGRRFPGYLQDTRPDKDAPQAQRELWIDFMVDLAGYERQLFVRFDAPGVDGQPAPGLDTPDEDLVLQTCFDLGAYRYPVAQYYHGVNADKKPDLPPQMTCHYALARQDYITTTYPVSPVQFAFLDHLRSGASIPDSLAWLSESHAIPDQVVQQSWKAHSRETWIRAGFFVARP